MLKSLSFWTKWHADTGVADYVFTDVPLIPKSGQSSCNYHLCVFSTRFRNASGVWKPLSPGQTGCIPVAFRTRNTNAFNWRPWQWANVAIHPVCESQSSLFTVVQIVLLWIHQNALRHFPKTTEWHLLLTFAIVGMLQGVFPGSRSTFLFLLRDF